ncbi:MAG: helix-turn-helix domain-containing protein [Negativicutes bacterium]
MSLGDKVRYAREQLGLTTQILAERAGVSQPYISEIENGNKNPSAKTIMKLSAALNVPGEFLLRNDVKTLAEMDIEAAVKNKIDSSKYFPYFVTVDQAITSGVTPDELLDAIQFIKKYKSGNK